jgi:membrane-bound lytic murein transglycosylase A
MMRTALASALALSLLVPPSADAGPSARILSFAELDGWAQEDHGAALDVFLTTCGIPRDPAWGALCRLARDQRGGRSFFELFFRPVLINGEDPALFTGYFEPELNGARAPDDRYRYPIYAVPPDLPQGRPWATRAEIENGDLLAEQDLEIAWVDDPVDLFFLQIQGSGRIRLSNGGMIRVGYGGHNGHEYRSVGEELIRQELFESHEVSAAVIRNWVQENPDEGRALLQHNTSYVFFREVSEVPAHKGPIGAMNRSITRGRSIAVDPAYTQLGAPVWIEKAGEEPMHRLMIAQDTGSVIKGAQRADIFFGTGYAAGRAAGKIRDRGRMVVLMPIDRAHALAGTE